METAWKAGLEDVIAGRSAICRVDGEAGRLYYRGYEVGDLTAHAPFEDVTALLWLGELPAALESERFKARLAAARGLPAPVRDLLQSLPRDTHPLDALRTAVSLAATFDPDTRASDPEANFRKAIRLTALVPETVATWQRIRNGKAPVSAPTSLSHAAYFLNLVDGRAPSPEVARVLDVVLTLHADHELNASTFAARVAVATLADLHAAIVSAISTLKGPRHGGANEDVLAMLLEIGQPSPSRGSGRAPGSRSTSAAIPRCACPGSAIASIAWTTRARACCGGWRSRWRKRPAGRSSSRSPSASTTRCGLGPRCR